MAEKERAKSEGKKWRRKKWHLTDDGQFRFRQMQKVEIYVLHRNRQENSFIFFLSAHYYLQYLQQILSTFHFSFVSSVFPFRSLAIFELQENDEVRE